MRMTCVCVCVCVCVYMCMCACVCACDHYPHTRVRGKAIGSVIIVVICGEKITKSGDLGT